MQEAEIKIIPSNNSFDIIGDTPKTGEASKNKKFSSYDILPETNESENDDDIPTLDEDGTQLKAPQNSPSINFKDTFMTKQTQIQNLICELKKDKSSNARRDIKCLERHLEKLYESEKNNLDFHEFKNKMIETAKNDKNMNVILKKLYK